MIGRRQARRVPRSVRPGAAALYRRHGQRAGQLLAAHRHRRLLPRGPRGHRRLPGVATGQFTPYKRGPRFTFLHRIKSYV